MNDIDLAKGLGLFSMALGTLELVAGRQLSGALGIGSPWLVRAFGAREIVAGLGVLSAPDRAGPVWGRVGGDAMDLAVLGVALSRGTRHRRNAAWATFAVVGATVLDIACATALTRRKGRAHDAAIRTRIKSVQRLAGV